ncbi:MAG: hypothetical protein LQ346_008392, partial [Caloplaca aetnensis]
MPLTVLPDADIRSLLYSLTREDILQLQENLSDALHEYSTGTQETTGCCSTNQPQRISIPAADGQSTTLFMPASTSTSRGIKIATLASAPEPSRHGSLQSLQSTHSAASSTPSSHSTTTT